MTRKLAVVAACLVVAGCGGGPGGSSSSSSGGSDYKNAQDVGDAVGCDQYKTQSEPMMLAAVSADCTLSGEDYVINWFNNDKARDNYMTVGIEMGGAYAYGKQWVVECDTTAQAEAIAKTTGGDTKIS